MKVYDRSGKEGETYVIPCKDASRGVGSLKKEVLARWAHSSKAASEQFQLALAGNGAFLCEEDAIQDVLQDGDFLSLRTFVNCNAESHKL